MQDMAAVHSISSFYLQLHLQFSLPAGVAVTGTVLASSPSTGEVQTLSTLSSNTAGQALDKQVELPDYLIARAAGLP